MKKTLAEKIIMWVAFAIFMLYAITLVYPFIWMLMNSFKNQVAFVQDVWGFPKEWMFSNYVEVFNLEYKQFTLLQIFINTLFYTLVSASLTVLVPAFTAYVYSKYKFKLRALCMAIVIITISVPVVGGEAATLKILINLKLYNNWYWGLFIMAASGFGGNFLMIRAAIDNTSWTYAEAAFIDGASDLKVMIRIMLPMVTPIMTILFIMGLIGSWNGYMAVYLYCPSWPTIGIALKQFVDNIGSADGSYPKVFSAMAITLLPVIILFLCFQKTIMNNFTLGGLKG